MPSVRLEHLSKSFLGKRKVLDDVSLEVTDGSVTSILAPTGFGKTTLLRIIAGIEKPDKGKVYFGEKNVTKLPAQKRNTAMVFQSFALYPNMTVFENIASPLKIMRLPRNDIAKRAQNQAEFLGIKGLLNRYPRELSGGERQRVAIARALAKGADVYLLDEPLTNLDYKIRESMRMELKKIFREIKSTVIYATPDPRETLSMSTHVAFLWNGKIGQYGPALEVYHKPKNTAVGTYYGYPPMNLIDCHLIQKNGRYYMHLFDEIDLEVSHFKDLLHEESYILGLRPNDLRLTDEGKNDTISLLPTVMLTEVMGSETIVYLKYRNSELKMLVLKLIKYDIGQRVKVFFNPCNLYIFGKKSKELITKYLEIRQEGSCG